MVSTNLSKDVKVEVIFSAHPDSGAKLLVPDNGSIYLTFDKDNHLWKVQLWQEKHESDFAINVPTRYFAEFEFPQGLFGRLEPGKEFEIWRGIVVGKGIVLELLNLEKRAQENIENISQRVTEEVDQILSLNKSLFGEPIFNDANKIFCQRLKSFLQMENTPDYLWLWKTPNRSHMFIEFGSPKLIPHISVLLPNNPVSIWFLVHIDSNLSTWFLYDATFVAIEKILEKHKFSQYYIVAKDCSWLIMKVNTKFVAIGDNVEKKLKKFQSMQNAA